MAVIKKGIMWRGFRFFVVVHLGEQCHQQYGVYDAVCQYGRALPKTKAELMAITRHEAQYGLRLWYCRRVIG